MEVSFKFTVIVNPINLKYYKLIRINYSKCLTLVVKKYANNLILLKDYLKIVYNFYTL